MPFRCHRARAAFLALSLSCSLLNFAARDLPPFRPPCLPNATAAAFLESVSFGDSPVGLVNDALGYLICVPRSFLLGHARIITRLAGCVYRFFGLDWPTTPLSVALTTDDGPRTTDVMVRYSLVAAVCVIAGSSCALARADWPEFRGPFANGHVAAQGDKHSADLPLNWSESQNIRWKTPIPYRGWSTPVIMGGQIWLTTATEDGHDFYVLCIDENSGKILHNKKLFHSDEPEPLGNNVNSYSTPSAAIEPGRVYVHFGSFGTACLDTKAGDVLWKRDDLRCRHYRGPSSSVVLFENLVILTFDGVDLQYTVALDKQTGKNVWKTDRDVQWNDQDTTGMNQRQIELVHDGDRRKAHSTPLLVSDSSGQPQLVSAARKRRSLMIREPVTKFGG